MIPVPLRYALPRLLSPSRHSSFDLDSSVMKQFHEMTNNRVHGKLLLILRLISLAWCAQVEGERKKKEISFNFIVSLLLSKKLDDRADGLILSELNSSRLFIAR